MSKKEITEFISESIDQVKSSLSKGLALGGSFDFDISVMTTKDSEGKIGIQLANLGHSRSTQHVHRMRFSIVDKKARDKNIQQCAKVLKEIVSELSELEKLKDE